MYVHCIVCTYTYMHNVDIGESIVYGNVSKYL